MPYKENVTYCSKTLNIIIPAQIKGNIVAPKQTIALLTPGTGGSTFDAACRLLDIKQITKAKRFSVYEDGSYRSPIAFIPGWGGGWQTLKNELETNPSCCDQLDVILLHAPFGVHELLQSSNNSRKYVTIIADPALQIPSCINLRYQRGYDYDTREELDNPQTRIWAGKSAMEGKCTAKTLEIAKKNIEQHCYLCGVQDDITGLLEAFFGLQSWPAFAFPNFQVRGDKIIIPTADTAEIYRKQHKFDWKLYCWARENWKQWKSEHMERALRKPDAEIICMRPENINSRRFTSETIREIEQYNQWIMENSDESNPNLYDRTVSDVFRQEGSTQIKFKLFFWASRKDTQVDDQEIVDIWLKK